VNKADRIKIAVQEIRLQRSAHMGPIGFHGETMRPFLGEGDLVVVGPVRWHDIRPGDIITYRFNDKFPTRRVIAIDRSAGTLIVHGDNVRGFPNEHVRREDVLGRAESRVQNGSRLDRHSREWRRVARRAVAAQRLARLAHTTPWPARGLFFRMARLLRSQ
jgi:hypothetical protein